MNYKLHYDKLIEKARKRKLTSYKESHHIIPKCMGGSDKKENLVDLTAREHFVAHILLTKIYPNEGGLIKAVQMMCIGQEERKMHNRMYGWLREKFSKRMSKDQSGEKNSQFGTIWICNIEKQENKKVDKNQTIPKGWLKGRNLWKKDLLTPNERNEKRKLETIKRNEKVKLLKQQERERKKVEK